MIVHGLKKILGIKLLVSEIVDGLSKLTINSSQIYYIVEQIITIGFVGMPLYNNLHPKHMKIEKCKVLWLIT